MASGLWQQLSGVRQNPSGLARRALSGRQFDQEPGAAIEVIRFCGRERDRATVSRHEVGRNREAEARPRVTRRFVERLEYPVALIGRESGTGVANLDQREPIGANGRKT